MENSLREGINLIFGGINGLRRGMTYRDNEVVKNTRSRVKINSKHTNLMIKSRIDGYNGK